MDVKVKRWEWKQSKAKTAKEIMMMRQGDDYNAVASDIATATNLSIIEARALYRRVAKELVSDGFVPAVVKRGRPKKVTEVDSVVADTIDVNETVNETVNEVVERTDDGERASIAEMREYLKNMELPVPVVLTDDTESVTDAVAETVAA